MHGKPTGRMMPINELPAKAAEVDGNRWLPRLGAIVRIKQRGEIWTSCMAALATADFCAATV